MQNRTVLTAILSGSFLLSSISFSANAGINDSWWLLYKVSDTSQVTYTKGPYTNKFSCEADKFSLKFGHKFIACVQ